MKNKQIALSPRDFLVLLGMAYLEAPASWTFESIAGRLGMSGSQVHASIGRLVASRILNEKGLKGAVNKRALLDFVLCGARYAYPAVLGRVVRGLRTGVESDLFDWELLTGSKVRIRSGVSAPDSLWVWPWAKGQDVGVMITPLHPGILPLLEDQASLPLKRALVHFDVLRAGQAREREAAERFFRASLAWHS